MRPIPVGTASLLTEPRRSTDHPVTSRLHYHAALLSPSSLLPSRADYYEHWWSIPQHNEDVLNDLPPALRSKLNLILNRDLVERFPVLQHMTIDIYLRVVQRLTYTTYLPGDFIVKQGEVGDHMYFIRSGKVDAILPNGVTVWLTLRPGDFFGEHSLLYLTRRDTSFRAVDFVDVLTMSRADFTELYISAPDFVREIQRADTERQRKRLELELKVVKKPKKSRTGDSVSTPSAYGGFPGGSPASASSYGASPSGAPSGNQLAKAAKGAVRMMSARLFSSGGLGGILKHSAHVAPAPHDVSSSSSSAASPSDHNALSARPPDFSGGSHDVKVVIDGAGSSGGAGGSPPPFTVAQRSGSAAAPQRHLVGAAAASPCRASAAPGSEGAPAKRHGGLGGLINMLSNRRLVGGRGAAAAAAGQAEADGMNFAALELPQAPGSKGRRGKGASPKGPQHPYQWQSTHGSGDSDDDEGGGLGAGDLQTVLPMQSHEVTLVDLSPDDLGAQRPRRRSLAGVRQQALKSDLSAQMAVMRAEAAAAGTLRESTASAATGVAGAGQSRAARSSVAALTDGRSLASRASANEQQPSGGSGATHLPALRPGTRGFAPLGGGSLSRTPSVDVPQSQETLSSAARPGVTRSSSVDTGSSSHSSAAMLRSSVARSSSLDPYLGSPSMDATGGRPNSSLLGASGAQLLPGAASPNHSPAAGAAAFSVVLPQSTSLASPRGFGSPRSAGITRSATTGHGHPPSADNTTRGGAPAVGSGSESASPPPAYIGRADSIPQPADAADPNSAQGAAQPHSFAPLSSASPPLHNAPALAPGIDAAGSSGDPPQQHDDGRTRPVSHQLSGSRPSTVALSATRAGTAGAARIGTASGRRLSIQSGLEGAGSAIGASSATSPSAPAWRPGGGRAAGAAGAPAAEGARVVFAQQRSLDRPTAGRVFRSSVRHLQLSTSPPPGTVNGGVAVAGAELSQTVENLLGALEGPDSPSGDAVSLELLARSAGAGSDPNEGFSPPARLRLDSTDVM